MTQRHADDKRGGDTGGHMAKRMIKDGTVLNYSGTGVGNISNVGTIEFDGTPISDNLGPFPALFHPRKHELGEMDVEYSSIDLREIADLMDALEADKKAAAAGAGK
jgi:hypothetical protein